MNSVSPIVVVFACKKVKSGELEVDTTWVLEDVVVTPFAVFIDKSIVETNDPPMTGLNSDAMT